MGTQLSKVYTESGAFGTRYVPSGASTGEYEAVELRDGDKSRYSGKGVQKASDTVTTLSLKLSWSHDVREQMAIDKLMIELDGTPNKGKRANAILAIYRCSNAQLLTTQDQPFYTNT